MTKKSMHTNKLKLRNAMDLGWIYMIVLISFFSAGNYYFLGGLKYEHTLKSNSKSELKKNIQLGQPGEVPRLLVSSGQEGERP